MAEYSQKWHNGTSKSRSTKTSNGLAAIQAQLNNLGREIKKVNEKVYAAQVGCEQCKGPHYIKDWPLKEEGKIIEEAYYTKSVGDTLIKSAKRHEENSNLIKEIQTLIDASVQNQGASIKTLEIQIRQVSKVLQERGVGSLPSSTESNSRDQVKSISTTIEADSCPICYLENMDAYRDEGMGDIIVGKRLLRQFGIKARRFDGTITLYKEDKSDLVEEKSTNIGGKFTNLEDLEVSRSRYKGWNRSSKVSGTDLVNFPGLDLNQILQILFSEHFKPGEACRLKKSLYGLKQSPKALFGRFTLPMKRYGFKQSNSNHTLFLKNRKNRVTCLIIYVDDMVITGNDEEEIKRLKEGLFAKFEMKDLGNLKYFLGIEVLRSPKGIFICQKNIGHAVGVVSRFMRQPHVAHMNAALRIVRTKHVEVDRHFIKEKLEAGIIELPFVKPSDQLADILIKAVETDMFHKCLRKLNFGNPTIQLEGECWKRK
nr:putative reverse transcriptase, RNA-dependent DNA polymerase [Tanacetum cinerariifolium]